jgi:hypothetical protein
MAAAIVGTKPGVPRRRPESGSGREGAVGGGGMTSQYLVGELSARLERLQAVTSAGRAAQVARLRHRVESCPLTWLAEGMSRALEIADNVCWDSLSKGDADLFARQACVSAELRQFGICAHLLADDPPGDDCGTDDGEHR